MRKQIKTGIIAIALIAFTLLGVNNISKTKHKIQFQDIQLKSTQSELIELQLEYDVLNTELDEQLRQQDKDTQKIEELKKEKQELESHRDALEEQLQAKLNRQQQEQQELNRIAQNVSGGTASAASCGDNAYKQYIYQKESGCNPSAVNSIGCRGIGQACPGSKLSCGVDFACQDAYFTQYAVSRYGSWENAYNFWINNHWW